MNPACYVDTLRLAPRAIPATALRDPDLAVANLSRARVRYLDTRTRGDVVVIAPDPPNTIEHHRAMVERLRATHRVIVFDLPGFGFSYPKLRYGFTASDLGGTLCELLDTLRIKDATVLFSCLASHAALRAAAERPDLIARLVLVQTPSLSDSLDWARRVDSNGFLGRPLVGQVMMAAMARKVADGWYRAALPKGADTSPYFQPAADALRHGGCYCLASAFQRFRKEDHGAPAAVRQPVTMFWGSADRTHRHSNPHGLLAQVPHAEIQVLEGCGHFPDLERTDVVLRAITEPRGLQPRTPEAQG